MHPLIIIENQGMPLKRAWLNSNVHSVGKESTCGAGDPSLISEDLVRKIHWRRDRLPTPAFWPGEFHGLYSPGGCKESGLNNIHFELLWQGEVLMALPSKCHHFSSVPQSCLTLWDPMDCSTPGFPVHHQLPEFDQTHVHQVDDDIQPSHPLSSPSPLFNLSLHLGLFQWVSSLHQAA